MTPRQLEVLRMVADYIDEHGWPPSVRDLMRGSGCTSPGPVQVHLNALEWHGLIVRGHGPRALRITDKGRELLSGVAA